MQNVILQPTFSTMFLKYGLKIDILHFAASSQLTSPHLHGEGVGVVEGEADVLQVVGEGRSALLAVFWYNFRYDKEYGIDNGLPE